MWLLEDTFLPPRGNIMKCSTSYFGNAVYDSFLPAPSSNILLHFIYLNNPAIAGEDTNIDLCS